MENSKKARREEIMENQINYYQSEQIGELVAALCKTKAVMGKAKKDSSNPFFHSKFTSLDAVIEASEKVLSDNGLVIMQPMIPNGTDSVVIATILAHTSGQWIRGELSIVPAKKDPQGFGSAITYGRRYSWKSMIGMSDEDDDGNAATHKYPPKKAALATSGIVLDSVATDQFEWIKQHYLDACEGDNSKIKPLLADALKELSIDFKVLSLMDAKEIGKLYAHLNGEAE